MSVVFVVTPMVIAAWPAMYTAIAAAAASMGCQLVTQTDPTSVRTEQEVDLPMEKSEIIEEQMETTREVILQRDDVTFRLYRDAQGRLRLHVRSPHRSREELRQLGQEMMGRIRQHYAYHRVVSELQRRGFVIAEEEHTAGQIRLRLRRFEG